MQNWIWVIAAALTSIAQLAIPVAQAEEERRPEVPHASLRALIGNTLVYAKPGQPGAETAVFIRLDGTGQAVTRRPDDASEPRAIQWSILSDGKFCVTDVGRRAWEGDCGVLSVDGALATLAPASGPAWPGRVLEGDGWKLDPASQSDQRLVGRAAIEALIGNTVVLIPLGGGREYLANYLMANGTVRRAHNDHPYLDHWVLQPNEKWSIRGESERLCFGGGAWKKDLCTGISVAGDLVTFHDEKIGLMHAKLLKGDARSLSLAAGAAARKRADALIDHTLELKPTDARTEAGGFVYFRRDGSGLAKWRNGMLGPIKWLLQLDGKLCIVERRREFRDSECSMLSIDGNAVTLGPPDRPTLLGRVVKGNALKM